MLMTAKPRQISMNEAPRLVAMSAMDRGVLDNRPTVKLPTPKRKNTTTRTHFMRTHSGGTRQENGAQGSGLRYQFKGRNMRWIAAYSPNRREGRGESL